LKTQPKISFSFCFLYSARSFFSSGQKAAAHKPPSRLLRSSAWALTHSQPNNQPPASTSPTWSWPRLHQQHSPQLPRALSLSRRTVFLILIFGIRSHGSLLYFFRSFFLVCCISSLNLNGSRLNLQPKRSDPLPQRTEMVADWQAAAWRLRLRLPHCTRNQLEGSLVIPAAPPPALP